jgi:ketosteroid isomerase-like protein
MTTREVAEAFAALCKEGRHEEAGTRFWAGEIVSIEAMDGPMAVCRGLAAVKAKTEWWVANHEVHGGSTQGPFVNGDSFALIFELDVTAKATGQRMQMKEVGLYTVAKGKVVEERFFY